MKKLVALLFLLSLPIYCADIDTEDDDSDESIEDTEENSDIMQGDNNEDSKYKKKAKGVPPKRSSKNKVNWTVMDEAVDAYDALEESKTKVPKKHRYCTYCRGVGKKIYYRQELRIKIRAEVECPYCKGKGYR